DRHLGQQRLGGDAAGNQVIRCRRLHDTILTIGQSVGVFGPARNNDAERGRGDVEALGDVFANADSVPANTGGWHLWLDHLLDAFQVRGKALSRPRRTRGGATPVTCLQPSLDLFYAGFDLIEDEGHLLVFEWIVPQPLRARAILGTLQLGDDGGQTGDALVSSGVDNLEFGDLGMGSSDHRLEGVDVI